MAARRGYQAIARGEVVSKQNGAGGDVGLVLGGGARPTVGGTGEGRAGRQRLVAHSEGLR